MKVLKITFDGETKNHYTNPKDGSLTLCCMDTIGDPSCGIRPAKEIEGKISCPDCIRIIQHCSRVYTWDINWNKK